MTWDYASELAWHATKCAGCGCARDQHEDDGCYGGCRVDCEVFE